MPRTKLLPTVLLVSVVAPAGCGDAPKSAPPTTSASTPSGAQDPHGGMQLPANHPPLEQPTAAANDPSQFVGRVLLKGALAEANTGAIFVTVRAQGTAFPMWTNKIDLDAPSRDGFTLSPAQNGVRELAFVLNQKTTMFPGKVDHTVPLEVVAMFDPDKSVDSKDGQVRATAPAKAGDESLSLELDPAAQK